MFTVKHDVFLLVMFTGRGRFIVCSQCCLVFTHDIFLYLWDVYSATAWIYVVHTVVDVHVFTALFFCVFNVGGVHCSRSIKIVNAVRITVVFLKDVH